MFIYYTPKSNLYQSFYFLIECYHKSNKKGKQIHKKKKKEKKRTEIKFTTHLSKEGVIICAFPEGKR